MKKVIAKAAGLGLALFGVLSLASCSASSFYSDWSKAGADINQEVPFEYISFDKAKEMKENKETFLVMFGSPSDSQDVTDVQGICYDAYVTNQKNKIYFINCEDASKVSVREQYRKELDVKNVLSPSYSVIDPDDDGTLNGLVAVLYKNGSVYFDTSRAYAYDFCSYFATSDSKKVNIHSVAAYAWEYYPVKND